MIVVVFPLVSSKHPSPGYYVEENERENETTEYRTDDACIAWNPTCSSFTRPECGFTDKSQQYYILS